LFYEDNYKARGEGERLAIFKIEENEEFLNSLNDFKSLPLDSDVKTFLLGYYNDVCYECICHGEKNTKYYNCVSNVTGLRTKIPNIKNGYYYIIDRYRGINKDKTTIVDGSRHSVNVEIFIYDSDNKKFYHYTKDT